MIKESKHIGKVWISIVCVILGILLALQFKSVRENAVDPLNATRAQTLQTLLNEEREENDRLQSQNRELQQEVQSYREAAANEDTSGSQTMLDEIARLEKKARAEQQPRKKFELAQQIKEKRQLLEKV